MKRPFADAFTASGSESTSQAPDWDFIWKTRFVIRDGRSGKILAREIWSSSKTYSDSEVVTCQTDTLLYRGLYDVSDNSSGVTSLKISTTEGDRNVNITR